ncbi:hypothetical protein VPH35_078098 [Triticum aestivum]
MAARRRSGRCSKTSKAGVQDVKVDAQLHKVMVTGSMDAETLIKRLYKSGKQALPWQHMPPKNPDPAPAEDGSKDAAVADKKPQADSSDKKPEQEKARTQRIRLRRRRKQNLRRRLRIRRRRNQATSQRKTAVRPSPRVNPQRRPAMTRARRRRNRASPRTAQPLRRIGPCPPAPAHAPRYNAPQPVMSYNMAQPRASVSSYAPQLEQGYSQQQAGYSSSSSSMIQQAYSQQAQPMQQWSPAYLYMPYPHASPESYYQDYYSPPGTHAPPPLQDSYRLFDDENPNSCSVM